MPWCVSPWVYRVWDSLHLLDLTDYFLFHAGEIFNYNLFKKFLIPFLFLFFFWDPLIRMLVHLILFQRSLPEPRGVTLNSGCCSAAEKAILLNLDKPAHEQGITETQEFQGQWALTRAGPPSPCGSAGTSSETHSN